MSTESSPSIAPAAVESPVALSTPSSVETSAGRNERGQFTKSAAKPETAPDRPSKTFLSANTALRLDTSIKDDVTAAIEKATKRVGIDRALKVFEQEEQVEKPKRQPAKSKPVSKPSPEAAPAPEAASPSAAPAPAEAPKTGKVVVGGREYTIEEVQARLEEIERAQRAPAAAPEPPAPSAEELASAEQKWMSDYSTTLEAPFTEDEVDTLLTGGEEAVQLMQNLRKRDIAYAVMQARKTVAEGLNPVLQQLFATVQPLAQHYESLQRYSVTQQYLTKYPEHKNHLDMATQVAETLMQRYPKEFNALSDEQKMAEVARQTTQILDTQWKRFNNAGIWRDASRPASAPVPPPPPVAPKPLASNPPNASPATTPGNWQSSVAKSLRR